MSRPRLPIDIDTIERAKALRASGASWRRLSELTGWGENALRRRLDPRFAERGKFKYTGPASFLRAGESSVSRFEERLAIAMVQPDTRSRHARFMGDPLPGRSALDRKRAVLTEQEFRETIS